MAKGEIRITDDLDKLLAILPPDINEALRRIENLSDIIEVVMDLGRRPEARFEDHFTFLKEDFVTREDIEYVVKRVGKFGDDNRAGIERTLHRISAIRNRTQDIIGLTMRVGRAVYGTITIIRDLLEGDESILLLGRPGIGKTTMLREMARVLADDFKKRVVIVDTSNEIAGDGDIPHPGIGLARRMQVPKHDLQHEVMIEAVQNHMPEVIVVDEIGTEDEAYAARTIAERGVQLIATAHGNTLENLLMNPTLSDLLGGIQAVTLSDEEARKRKTQKTILERKAPPTFDIIVEIQEKDRLAIHYRVDEVVDMILRGNPPIPEIRVREEDGSYRVIQKPSLPPLPKAERKAGAEKFHRFYEEKLYKSRGKSSFPSVDIPKIKHTPQGNYKPVKIYPYAVSRNRIEKAVEGLGVKAEVVRRFEDAHLILTLKSQENRGTHRLREMAGRHIPIFTIRSNTVTQIQKFLREYFQMAGIEIPEEPKEEKVKTLEQIEKEAIREAQEGIQKVLETKDTVELNPRNAYLRQLQHQYISRFEFLRSESRGKEPLRRVCIYLNPGYLDDEEEEHKE